MTQFAFIRLVMILFYLDPAGAASRRDKKGVIVNGLPGEARRAKPETLAAV